MISKDEFEKAAQEAFRNAALEMKAFCADQWDHTPRDADDRRKKLLQVQTDLASKIIFYGETEEKLSQLHVVDKALNS